MTPLVTPYFSLTLVCHHAPKKGVGALGIEALFGHMSIAGVPISQDLVNIAFVGVFLGIPLVALLVARICAVRRNRVEERIPRATLFSGDLLDELPESMKPEVLGVPFCGQVGGRVFALSVLSLLRDGSLSMRPTSSPAEGAYRFDVLDQGMLSKAGLASATTRVCLPAGSLDKTVGGAIARYVKKPDDACGPVHDFTRCAGDQALRAGYLSEKDGGSGNATVVLMLAQMIVGSCFIAFTTLPGLSAIAVVIGGFVALIFTQGSLGTSVNADKLQDVLARADAHRRWIVQRYRSGEALPGSAKRVDRTLRFALAFGLSDEVVAELARRSGDEDIEWFLTEPAEGFPSPLRALEKLFEVAVHEDDRMSDS